MGPKVMISNHLTLVQHLLSPAFLSFCSYISHNSFIHSFIPLTNIFLSSLALLVQAKTQMTPSLFQEMTALVQNLKKGFFGRSNHIVGPMTK